MTTTSSEDATRVERGDPSTHDDDGSGEVALEPLAPTQVGRYLLLTPLGKGAFGSVWTAYDPELDRKVAVKLMTVRDDGGRDELMAEAQLPAQLSHPNIVAIHDVGWADGQARAGTRALYVVMEHLGGQTLRAWFDEGPRDWREVVRVLVEAGRGLEAAHQRKLIHLDFKPGNVMFGEDGRPRVLDFGLARVLSTQRDPSESGTVAIAGTPAYMAPEQHAGAETDERADQYAFAVTLWLGLWGQLPFLANSSTWLRDLVKQKHAGPPTPPRKPPVPAHVRAVVTRALAPKPEDRFADMAALLAALTDDPALRRRRRIYAGLGAAAILGLSYGALTREDPCALPEDRFAGIWDAELAAELDAAFAEAEVEIADEAMTLVRAGLDDQIARWTATRAQICEAGKASGSAREAMSEEFLCLEVHLGRIAALTESLRTANSEVIARAADSVVQLDDPERCLEARRDRARRELSEDERAALLEAEALVARALAETSLARFEPALTKADEAVARAEALGDPELIGEAMLARGRALELLGRYDDSRVALLDAMRSADLAGDRRTPVEAMLALTHGLTQAGHYDEATLASELASVRLSSIDDAKLAVRLDAYVSQLRVRQHRWDEALVLAQDALDRQLARDPDDHVLLADLHLALGNVHTGSGREPERGREHYERARELWLELYGPGHPNIATVLVNLSAVDFARADYAAAREHLEAGMEAFTYTLPPNHSRFGVINQNLAALHMVEGHYAETIVHSERALEVLRESVGADSTHYAVAESNLVAALTIEARYAEALDHARHVAEVYGATLEPGDGRRLAGLGMLIEALWAFGRDDEALELLAELRATKTAVDEGERHQSEALYVIAEAHRRAGELDEALALCEELLTYLDGDLSEPEPVADVAVVFARTLHALGRSDEARTRVEPLLERLGGASESAHRASWAVRLELGRIARSLGDDDEARAHYEAAAALVGDAPLLRVEVELALAELELEAAPTRVRAKLEQIVALVEEAGARPDLLAEARRLLELA